MTVKTNSYNLAIRADLPGKDNSWWAEPAYADNLSEACKSVPNNTWRTILKCSPKRTRSTQAAISNWLRKTTLTNNLANTIGPESVDSSLTQIKPPLARLSFMTS